MSKSFYEDENAKQEIVRLNKKIFNLDPTIKNLYQKGRQWSLMCFEKIYKRLGARFDFYYFESKVAPVGFELVKRGLARGVFQESDGAVIFPGEKYGLHSRVFINSQGLPTYEAKELGLALVKHKDFRYDLSVIVTGNEIVEYFKVLIAAIKEMLPALGSKTVHVPHGMVRLAEGKMASRKGNIITAEQLLDDIKELALKVTDVSSKFSTKERNNIAESITIGAVKYAWLKARVGQDIVFDFKKSLNIKGDSGPYLQYTHARCKSVLRKAKARIAGFKLPKSYNDICGEELEIVRIIYQFPEIVTEAAEKFSPSLICNFAFDLAQKYNAFYDRYSILKAGDKELKQGRLCLTAAVAQVLKNSLFLLGIKAPEKM